MDSKELEDLCNTTEAEDETVANEKKRLRRVSFADNITSVHIFDRDEDLETPPDSKPSSETNNAESAAGSEPLGFRGDSADSDDSKELLRNEDGDDDDEFEGRMPFVRNMDFLSPGSTAGSVTSNEEDDFFGPVSASFIRPGRLSTESATSDDNHDITIDSTAFSLHFRNLMQSDGRTSNSGGSFKKLTEVPLEFDEKTPGEDSKLTNSGSFMVLTGTKTPIPHMTGGRSNGGGDSNDMSLIVENPRKYDYGELSPSLDALLTEGHKEFQHVSVSNQFNIPKSSKSPSSESRFSTFNEHGSELMDLKSSDTAKVQGFEGDAIPAEVLSVAASKPSGADDRHGAITAGHISSYHSPFNKKETSPPDTVVRLQNKTRNEPTQGMFSQMVRESLKDVLEVTQPQIELGFANNGRTLSPLNEMSSKNLIIQQEYGPTGHIKDRTLENHLSSQPSPTSLSVSESQQRLAESPKSGRYVPVYVQNADEDLEPSSLGSISSLRAKRQRLFLYTSVLVSRERTSTPFAAEKPRSPLNKEGTDHGMSISPIKNKISKFDLHETWEVAVNNLKPSLSGLANKPSLFEDVLVENNKDPKSTPVAHSVTDVEGHLLVTAAENTTQEIAVEIHGSRVETPKNFNISRLLSGKSPAIFHDGGGLGKHTDENPLMFHTPIEGAVSTPITYPSRIHKTAELKNIKHLAGTPSNFVSLPVKRLEQNFSPPRPSNQQIQSDKLFGSSPSYHIEDSLRTVPNESLLLIPGAEDTIQPNSLLKENRGHSIMPLVTINTDEFRSFGKREETAGKESLLWDLQNQLKSTEFYETPVSNKVTLKFHSGRQYTNVQKMGHANFCEKFSSERELGASSYESAPPDLSKRTGPRTLSEKIVARVAQSASRKDAYNSTQNDNLLPLSRKVPVSPLQLQYLMGFDRSESQPSPSLRRSSFVLDVDNSGRKTSDEIAHMEKNHTDDIGRNRKSGKVALGMDCTFSGLCLERHVAGSTDTDMSRGESLLKNWSDVFSRFSAAAELLPISTDKLNLRELGILEDMLSQMERAQKYKKIYTEIQSQKMHQHLGNIQQQRMAGARWLQHMLVFERSKLRLHHLKRDRLLRKVQQLQSGIQDCHTLKCNILQHSQPGKRNAQTEDRFVQSLSIECNAENQDSCHNVIKMRKELGVLDHKVKRIIEFFQASCKINGDHNFDEIVAVINDHLQKQERCRLIRQYLQLWELDDIERKADHRNVVLNYRGLLSRRLTTNNGPVSTIVSSNLLNDANITMNFPNMNACLAFEFVFNDKSNCWLGNPKSFQQDTQLTSFLLGNLLDVIEEVQAAQMELYNLVKANFHSPCVGQLELQLCFIDFKTGRNLTLIIDMTELNCGIYPSDILPSQLKIQTTGTQAASAALLSAEILDAVQNLNAGLHSMIIRLCHCVSQVVLSSTR